MDKGVITTTTPDGDKILFGEAFDSEMEASRRGGRRGAAQDAMRLYARIAEYFPASPLAAESLYRSADIRWQIEAADQATRPSAKMRDPALRVPIDEEHMKQVIKKYPGTKWADLAAYHLIDNKLCGEWEAQAQVSREGSRDLSEVRRRASAVAQGRRGALQGGVALFGADRDLQDRQPAEEGRRLQRARPQRRQETNFAIPQRRRLVQPRRASGIHGAEQNPHIWEQGGVVAARIEIAVPVKDRFAGYGTGRRGGDLNDYLLSVLLGIIEGLTEFLPVSSTAHLRIAEAFLGVDLGNGYWKMFSIVIQLGAILCLPLYFWNRIVEFVHDFPQGKNGDRTVLQSSADPDPDRLRGDGDSRVSADQDHRQASGEPASHGLGLIIGGIVMWIVDAVYERSQHKAFARGKLTEDMEQMSVGPSRLDWLLPDLLGGLSRHLALHVDHYRRANWPA